MREFKIYGEIGSNPDTPKFRAFVKNIEAEIDELECKFYLFEVD